MIQTGFYFNSFKCFLKVSINVCQNFGLPLLTREGDLFEKPNHSGRPWNLRVHSFYVLRLMQKCIPSKQIFVDGFLKKGPPKQRAKVAFIEDSKNYKNQQYSCSLFNVVY